MKIQFFILFCLTFQLSSCQEKFNNKSIFLGEYTKDSIKTYTNDSIRYIAKDSLKQTNQFTPKEFIKILDSLNLFFIAEGDEPFWQLKLNSSELTFMKYDFEKEVSFKPIISIDEQSGFNIMFKSRNNKIFGLIKRIDNKLEAEKSCDLSLSDNYLTYEVFVSMEGKVFKGCCSIDEKQ
ncbi:hypothetical protein [Psychroserpens sp. NJDZ02]|uniref:hypothetical protein n=1 Tax=Psychroserpens sp. NJDZ02 TaxID=2570561 RepID=UPI0010A889C6|nr:hypothetical protein [Psychroserpens sp. NJDZ02]QCE42535.1 hypothetical protein E9099_14360 [Psychroserpens sp. NJDZ02]